MSDTYRNSLRSPAVRLVVFDQVRSNRI